MPESTTQKAAHTGQCHCGQARFTAHGAALLRLICHCTICQAYNKAPFSDIAFFRSRDVQVANDSAIAYRAWRRPPAVQRGACKSCDDAVVEHLKMPGLGLTMIAVARLQETAFLPEPALHLFYERRQADIEDGHPKYSGYWPSELALLRHLVPALLRH